MNKKSVLTFISIFIVISSFSIVNIEQATGYEMTYRMTYGNFAIVWDINELGTNSYINWNFRSFSNQVGVKVNIMDSYDFWRYNVKKGDYGKTVSNGSELQDSGIFQLPYTSKWYVVFSINDIDALNVRTDVYVKVDFIAEKPLKMIRGLSIGLPLSSIIIAASIFGYFARKQRKLKTKT
jgi:hypothetical protein